MRNRYKLPPDTRLDWRDPNMPVLRRDINGKELEVKPQHITDYYAAKLQQVGWKMPSWDEDESYWWNKRVKKN
jgi:hypothetical protein